MTSKNGASTSSRFHVSKVAISVVAGSEQQPQDESQHCRQVKKTQTAEKRHQMWPGHIGDADVDSASYFESRDGISQPNGAQLDKTDPAASAYIANHARSNMTLHWKPCFLRGLIDSKFDNHRLQWTDNLPKRLLVIKKPDPAILPSFIELLVHLVNDLQVVVFVECSSVPECEGCIKEAAAMSDQFKSIAPKLKTFVYGEASFTDRMIDLIVCLGGDGTLLYASSLFKADVPPILAFHLGSLGFLTPHKFENYRQDLQSVLNSRSYFTMRSRLACTLFKAGTGSTENKQVLNEVVIDRGPSGNICILDVIIEDQTVTTMQGDGLIVSSPTGSTAYAMAAGANMLHPSVPALLLAPICPHSLSFRPVILPASTGITVRLAEVARSNAWVSFDGRDRQELLPGDHVAITTSEFMVPSISARSPLQDWFSGLAECFHWNVRSLQKALPTGSASSSGSAIAVAAAAAASSSSSTVPLAQNATSNTVDSSSDSSSSS